MNAIKNRKIKLAALVDFAEGKTAGYIVAEPFGAKYVIGEVK